MEFTKMHGAGNDYVVIDGRDADMDWSAFALSILDRHVGIGGDGLLVLVNSTMADVRMRMFNPDGSEAEMCGNGGRCVARYAVEKKITSNELTLETVAGIIAAKVDGVNVRVKLTSPENLKQDIVAELNGLQYKIDSLNTGVPHAIIYSEDIENVNVKEVGNGIRFHEVFAPSGTNVNFVEKVGEHDLKIRTYERGVEDETLACGTGTVASALLSSYKNLVKPPVKVETRGGEILKVDFDPSNETDVFLEGLTRIAFEGVLKEY